MTDAEDKDADSLELMLQSAVDKLGEHFDSVQIIATKEYQKGDYVRFNSGSGPYYSRIGSVREFVEVEQYKKQKGVNDSD